MGFLFGGGKTQAQQQAAAAGLQVQTSLQGKPIPLLYGTVRVPGNLIWYGDFDAELQPSSGNAGKGGVGGGGGGKGGGGSGEYVYSASFEMALCEGPITGIGNVYLDKNITSLSTLGISFFDGSYGQSPWGYLIPVAAEVTESHTVPASGPYTVAIGQGSNFLADVSVTRLTNTNFTRSGGEPAQGEYNVATRSTGVVYGFNAADAGSNITIRYNDLSSGNHQVQATVPTVEPFNVPLLVTSAYFTDQGVSSTGIPFTAVASAPAANQYVAGATYTFNAANAGQTITVTYQVFSSANQALGYSGVAYVAAAKYNLGNSPQLPNFNFEVAARFSTSLAGLGVPDADPSLVVADLLSNPHYGAGFPSARIGDLSAYQAYCIANGLWISPVYDTQSAARAMLSDIATATNSDFVWSQGLLTLVPYGDASITANGYTYTAPSAPLYDLTDDDFLPNTNATGGAGSNSDDPVLLTRKRAADAYNSLPLECLDRSNAYNPAIVQAQDLSAINDYGLRQPSAGQAHLFCDLNAGRMSAQLQLQRNAIRNVYQFTLDQRYVLLDPMDIVTITDANLGLSRQWVRITEITENDDRSLSVTAEEYLDGAASAPIYSFQQGQGFAADYNASPGDANVPVLFEPTAELAEALEVWIAASGGPLWGGCDIWISNDGDTYAKAGRITGSARQGVLTSPLPSFAPAATGQTIDQTNTLSVDLTESEGALLSASQSDATALATLAYVDGEYLAYQSALLTGANAYNLSYLVRGAYGSSIGAHAGGSQFARLDGSIFKYPFTSDFIGRTIYIKLAGFNVYGGGLQNLSDLQPFAYTLKGTAYSSPLPNLTNLRSSYVASITQLAWDEVTDFRPVQYEIRQGAQWSGAQVLGRVAHPPFNVQGNGTYWVAAYSQPVPGLQVYSESPQSAVISGAQITSNVIATYDEAGTGWTGTFGGEAIKVGTAVYTTGAGDILSDPDYLGTPNIFTYGSGGEGTYEIPAGHVINIGRVAPCSVIVSWTAIGQHQADNILNVPDFLGDPDILDYAASNNIDVYPEIALSQDGSTWGGWQKYSAGTYTAKAFKARISMNVFDPTVLAILSAFVFSVDVPDRDDHYVNLSVASGGTTISFTPDGSGTPAPFNGGPQGSPTQPAIQGTIRGGSAGDQLFITSVNLSGCTVQVKNAGAGVARNIDLLAQGY